MSTTPEVPGSPEPETTPSQPGGHTTPTPSVPATEQPTQPLPSQHHQPMQQPPTNPFLPPHAAPADDLRAQYAAQQQAAQLFAAQQHAAALHAAQLHAAQQGSAPYPAPDPLTGTVPSSAVPDGRRRSIWLPVTATAAAVALVVSFGTAAFLGAFSTNDTHITPASIATIGQSTNASVPVAGSTSSNPDWQKVASAVQASVVAIEVTTTSGSAQGSGVILDTKGDIITNDHVVAGAQGDVKVTLTDGRLFNATIVGTDTTTDLAVIKLKSPPSDLVPAAIGDSSAVVVGQAVMAVGNPLGLANTVTTGIVSAVDRPVSTSESGSPTVVTNAIQIDAAVNPGNSGGPLFDASGRVIGITSSIATLSSSSGSIGLGFAIPVNLVKNISSQLVASGTAQHAFLGVSLTDGTATVSGTTRLGAAVQQVTSGSPAASAGVQVNDVVVAIDNKPVGGSESLTAYVRALPVGAQSTLTIVRGGKAINVTVTVAGRADTAASSGSSSGSSSGGSPTTPPTDPNQMTPQQLWQWYQQQQGGSGQGGSGQVAPGQG
jgi:putative serine protease PepD